MYFLAVKGYVVSWDVTLRYGKCSLEILMALNEVIDPLASHILFNAVEIPEISAMVRVGKCFGCVTTTLYYQVLFSFLLVSSVFSN